LELVDSLIDRFCTMFCVLATPIISLPTRKKKGEKLFVDVLWSSSKVSCNQRISLRLDERRLCKDEILSDYPYARFY
jgi:hypothetical protein